MHIFSPLDSDIYITLKHFETLAGSKRGFKNRIIAISVLDHMKKQLSSYRTDFLPFLFEWLDLSYFGNQGTF